MTYVNQVLPDSRLVVWFGPERVLKLNGTDNFIDVLYGSSRLNKARHQVSERAWIKTFHHVDANEILCQIVCKLHACNMKTQYWSTQY